MEHLLATVEETATAGHVQARFVCACGERGIRVPALAGTLVVASADELARSAHEMHRAMKRADGDS